MRCSFCGAVSTQRRRASKPTSQQASQRTVAIIVGVLVGTMAVGAAVALVAGGASARNRSAGVQAPRAALPPKPVLPTPVPPVPPPPEPPPPTPWGELQAVAVDEQGDVLAVLGDTVVKVERASFTVRWTSPYSSQRGHLGSYRMIVPRGAYVAVISDRMAAFFESATGAKVNEFQYRRGGILQRVCAAGSTQVVVDVLGESLQRFDAATGQRASSGPTCTLREKVGCPSTQRCGWERVASTTHECRYAVRAAGGVFRDCVSEDGQKRAEIVASGPGEWAVPAGVRVDTYFGVVDETLIVSGRDGIVALDPATGDERWRRRANRSSAVVADGTTLYFGVEGTLVAANARTGEELQRLPMRTATAKGE